MLLMGMQSQVVKWPLRMAWIQVVWLGLKQQAWRYWRSSEVLLEAGLMVVAALAHCIG
jgi:hypothetical protein